MADEREIAREILSGKISVDDAARSRRSSPPPATTATTNITATTPPRTPPPPLPPNAVPETKPPTLTNAPAEGANSPAKTPAPGSTSTPPPAPLKCPYCGFVEQIAPSAGKIQEHDFQAALQKIAKDRGTIAGRSTEVRCPGCGATVLLEDNIDTESCPFCATHLENVPRTAAGEMICPESLLPFKVSQRDAITAFNSWINSRWFAPNNLKQLANLGQLSGVYLPFWTYDDMTYSHYTGMRGDDYWETETYTTTENGREVTKTRQVRKTRWTFVSGEVDHFFDDVLVCASRSLPTNYVNQLEPWDLQDLAAFNSAYLAGFKTERYTVSLSEGFNVARQIMAAEIRRLVTRNIGGDHQQITTVNTQDVGVTFKHLLLPLWLAVYRYQNATYRILVNARTGEVTGSRPYSWIKIALAVLLALIVAAVIFYFYSHYQQNH